MILQPLTISSQPLKRLPTTMVKRKRVAIMAKKRKKLVTTAKKRKKLATTAKKRKVMTTKKKKAETTAKKKEVTTAKRKLARTPKETHSIHTVKVVGHTLRIHATVEQSTMTMTSLRMRCAAHVEAVPQEKPQTTMRMSKDQRNVSMTTQLHRLALTSGSKASKSHRKHAISALKLLSSSQVARFNMPTFSSMEDAVNIQSMSGSQKQITNGIT